MSLVSGMVLSFFLKDKQKSKVFITSLITLITLLSLRTNPDEYLRYLYNECSTIEKVFNGFPFSESIFRYLGFLSLKTFNPRFSIYFISYGLIFLCLNYSLKLYRLEFQYRIIPIAFYLSHYFLSLSYISIRAGVANTFAFLSISILLNRNNFKIASIFALIGFFIHLQVVPFLLIGFAYFYIKDIPIFKSKYFLIFIMPAFFVICFSLRAIVEESIFNFLSSAITFDPKYLNYLSTDSYGYQINIFSTNVLFSFVLQIFLTFIFVYFLKIKDTNFRFALILASLYILIMVVFSNIAIYAFRFASTFVLFNLPLIGLVSKKMHFSLLLQKKPRISFLTIIAIIGSLLFYNLINLGRLNSFSFTLEKSADYFLN